jgi:alanine racemase
MQEKTGLEKALGLKKSMHVKARMVCSRAYTSGGLGYSAGSQSMRKRAKMLGVSVVRVGYADGFLRENGVLDENQVGVLCMDAQVRLGKASKGELIPVMVDAYQSAKAAGTISYEILGNATKRAEMVYLYQNEK